MGFFARLFSRGPRDPFADLRMTVQQDSDTKDVLNKSITALLALDAELAQLGVSLRERGSSAQDILKIQNAVWKLGFFTVDVTQLTRMGTPEQLERQGAIAKIRADSVIEIRHARESLLGLIQYALFAHLPPPEFPQPLKPLPEIVNDAYVSFRGTLQVKLQDFQDDFIAERLLDQHTVNAVFQEFNAKLSDTFLLIESTINRLRLLAMPPNT